MGLGKKGLTVCLGKEHMWLGDNGIVTHYVTIMKPFVVVNLSAQDMFVA